MFKKLLTAASIVTITLFLLPACAKQDNAPETTADSGQTTDASAPMSVNRQTQGGQGSVMDQPVNFSSRKEVNKSIEKVIFVKTLHKRFVIKFPIYWGKII